MKQINRLKLEKKKKMKKKNEKKTGKRKKRSVIKFCISSFVRSLNNCEKKIYLKKFKKYKKLSIYIYYSTSSLTTGMELFRGPFYL